MGRFDLRGVGLCSQTDAVVLLDFCIEQVLGEPLLSPSLNDRFWRPRILRRSAMAARRRPRSDVYSVGVLGYEMLGGDVQLLTQALRSRRACRAFATAARVPPHLENAILAALRANPASVRRQKSSCRS